jgi:hypothetical protein
MKEGYAMVFTKHYFKKRSLVALSVVSFLVSALSAQVKDTINGSVTDSLTSTALDSVTVSSEGVSVKTNAAGTFSLIVSPTQVMASGAQVKPQVTWNAARGVFSWQGISGDVGITVQDVGGRVISRYTTVRESGKTELSLADLHQGIFLVSIAIKNQTNVYRILRLQGDNSHSFKTISQSSSSTPLTMAKQAATTKLHVVTFTKNGYNTATIPVAAGTATTALVKVKMVKGGTSPGVAIDSVNVPGSGASVTFKTGCTSGELYLLKAIGTVSSGTDEVDAEFGGFGTGVTGTDLVGGVDVGIDIGIQKLRQNKTGREKWAGPYNPNHIYYMLVTGTGIPLTLKLTKSGTAAATGSITVALIRLSPYPPQIGVSSLDSVLVPVIQQIVHTTVKPTKSAVYLLQCSGQGHAGGNNAGMGDADYMDYDSTTGAGAEDIGDCNTDYGVGIDDTVCKCNMTPRTYWWGLWRKDRFYYTLYTGTGNPITIMFFDSGYGDNSTTAKLKVKVYPVP